MSKTKNETTGLTENELSILLHVSLTIETQSDQVEALLNVAYYVEAQINKAMSTAPTEEKADA